MRRFILLALGHRSPGYITNSPWTAGSNVVIQLGLGSSSTGLQDGFKSWNAPAADTLDIWSGYPDFITLSSISSASVRQISDGRFGGVVTAHGPLADAHGVIAFTVHDLKRGSRLAHNRP